jgi:hypothetical protein
VPADQFGDPRGRTREDHRVRVVRASLPALGPVFVALAVIFLSLVLRDYLKAEAKLSPSRQAWLRIAFIFANVSIGLYAVQIFFR